jgi:Fe-S cluster biogenesis protein NfuA
MEPIKLVSVDVEYTPNPRALKFITDCQVAASGKVALKSPDECVQDLEKELFALSGVEQIHYFDNVITVSQNGSRNWDELVDEVKQVIQTRLLGHNSQFEYSQKLEKKVNAAGASEDVLKINEVLDRLIRPALQGDGGDIEVLDYKDNVLKVFFQGACGGCPSSTAGTLSAIEATLREEFNPQIQVVPSM